MLCHNFYMFWIIFLDVIKLYEQFLEILDSSESLRLSSNVLSIYSQMWIIRDYSCEIIIHVQNNSKKFTWVSLSYVDSESLCVW